MPQQTRYSTDQGERRRDPPSLLQNISWLGLANIAVKPFWFVFITAVCMRLLGVEEYGIMTAALSLGMIGAAFIDLGMTQYTVREVSKMPADASRYFSNFMSLRVGTAFVVWIATVCTGMLLAYRGSTLVAVAFAGIYALTLNVTNYCRGFFRAFEELRQEAVMLVIEKTFVIAGGLTLLIHTRTASWTLAGMALGMVVTATANTWWIHHRFASIQLRLLSWPFLKRSLKAMIPFGLASLFTIIYYRVDAVMIEAYLGETPTGQYGAAFRILEALNMLPAIVSVAAIYPRLSKLHHDRARTQFSDLLLKSTGALAGLSLLATVPLTFFAAPVITLLDPDPTYAPAADALRILVWSFPFFCVKSIMYAALLAMDLQRFASAALALAVISNVGLNVVLIPEFGINGAAVATIIPEVLLVGIYIGAYRFARPSTKRAAND